MTDEELIRLLRDQRDYKCDLAADRIEGLNAKLAKALAMLASIGNTQTSGGEQASVMAFHAREALAEIKGEAE